MLGLIDGLFEGERLLLGLTLGEGLGLKLELVESDDDGEGPIVIATNFQTFNLPK